MISCACVIQPFLIKSLKQQLVKTTHPLTVINIFFTDKKDIRSGHNKTIHRMIDCEANRNGDVATDAFAHE